MKINKIDMLCTKIEIKQNKEQQKYLILNLLDMTSGDNFNIVSKDIELLATLKPMTKVKVSLNLTSTRYGLKLDVVEIIETLGSI